MLQAKPRGRLVACCCAGTLLTVFLVLFLLCLTVALETTARKSHDRRGINNAFVAFNAPLHER